MSVLRAALIASLLMACAVAPTVPPRARPPSIAIAVPPTVPIVTVAAEPPLPEGVPDADTPLEHDCHHDGWRYDEDAVQSALAERRAEYSGDKLTFVVFPNSEAPMIRETRRFQSQCEVTYFGLIPDVDSCQGVHYRATLDLASHCCAPRACAASDEVWAKVVLLQLVDGISLRQPSVLRKYIAPGGSLIVRGSAGETAILARTANDATIVRAIERTPGWSGEVSILEPTRDGAETTWTYGSGGSFVKIAMIPAPKPQRWYASSITHVIH